MSVRILIIEDEPGIAEFLVRGLSEEGYAVAHVEDGQHAWLRLRSDTWDLVILDWWLPGEDGLAAAWQRDSKRQHTRGSIASALTAVR
jgi:DNA-binding response OmpR family regulator